MELLGREKELAAATAAIAAVGEGAPRALARHGRGRDRQERAAARRAASARAARGLLVLAGRAAEHERDVPFGLVVDALDDHVAAMHHRRVETIGPGARRGAAQRGRDGRRRRARRRARRPRRALPLPPRAALPAGDDGPRAAGRAAPRRPALGRRGVGRARPAPAPPPARRAGAARLRDAPGRPGAAAARRGPHRPVGAELVAVEPLDHDASLALAGDIADPALRDRVARDARGNPLFLQELARAARDPAGPLPETLLAAIQLEVDALPPASRDADRRRGGGRRPVRPGARRGGRGARPRRRARRRSTGSWPPTSSARATTRARSASATRSCCARSTTARRPPGGSAPTSASPPCSRPAAPRPACAPTTSSSTRARATRRAIALLGEAAAAAAATAPATAARWYGAAVRLLPDGDAERRGGLLAAQAVALADAGRLEEGREALIEVLGLLPPGPSPFKPTLVAGLVQVEQLLGRHADANRRLAAALEEARARGARDARDPAGDRLRVRLRRRAGCGDGRRRGRSPTRPATPRSWSPPPRSSGLGAQWEADRRGERRRARGGRGRLRAARGRGARRPARHRAVARLGADAHGALRAAPSGRCGAPSTSPSGSARRGCSSILTALRSLNLTNSLELDEALRMSELGEERARLAGQQSPLFWALWSRVLVKRFAGEQAEAERAAAEALDLIPRLEPDRGVHRRHVQLRRAPRRDRPRALRARDDRRGRAAAREGRHDVGDLAAAPARARRARPRPRRRRRALRAARRRARASASASPSAPAARRPRTPRCSPRAARPSAPSRSRSTRWPRRSAWRPARDAVESRLTAGRALAAAGRREEAVAMLQRAAADAGRAGRDALPRRRGARAAPARLAPLGRDAARRARHGGAHRARARHRRARLRRASPTRRWRRASSSRRRRSSTTSRASTRSSASARASSSRTPSGRPRPERA